MELHVERQKFEFVVSGETSPAASRRQGLRKGRFPVADRGFQRNLRLDERKRSEEHTGNGRLCDLENQARVQSPLRSVLHAAGI